MLIIGQPAVAGPSVVSDNGEVPSWWFPSNPAPRTTASATPPPSRSGSGSGSDPDDLPTMVIPSLSSSSREETARGSVRAPTRGPGYPRLLAGLIGGMLAAGVLGLAALAWIQRPGGDGHGAALPPPAAPAPQPGKAEAEGARKPIEADTRPPAAEERSAPPTAGGARAPDPGESAEAPRAAAAPPAPPAPTSRLQVLVPAYFFPTGAGLRAWQRLMADSSRVPIVAVANPGSGPGEQEDPSYRRVIDAAAGEKGMRVIGYVNTGYAKRPGDAVMNDIDRWVELYPAIQGFFFDQQSPQAQHVDFYIKLNEYARHKVKDALVVGNPGTTCDLAYFARAVSDITCIFASFEGFDQLNPPIIPRRPDSSRIAALLYQIPDAKAMRQVLKEAVFKGISYIYISDAEKGSNPWGQLPAYWDDEVEAMSQAR
jgi:hypothetical protein